MIQLIPPNLSVVGYPDYCLAYVEQVFGVKNDPDPDAWHGWLNTKFKHTDPVPTDVAVPVWFSWTGTIGGITQNWGHVAVSTPTGVYTNPLSGSGHKVFPSVQALATAYGVKYVGWSEDLGNLSIVGDNVIMEPADYRMNSGDVINGFKIWKAVPSQADLDVWTGQTFKKFQYEKITDGVAKMPPTGFKPYEPPEMFVKE